MDEIRGKVSAYDLKVDYFRKNTEQNEKPENNLKDCLEESE